MARIFRTVIRIITCIALIICPMPEKKCEAEFNGTFLQSWMSSSWDDGRWQEEIGAMKEAGIKYLIIQDVVHKASDGTWTVYYNSELDTFKDAAFGASDVVEAALRNCAGSGIKVMVGLGLYDEWWTKSGFGQGLRRALRRLRRHDRRNLRQVYFKVSRRVRRLVLHARDEQRAACKALVRFHCKRRQCDNRRYRAHRCGCSPALKPVFRAVRGEPPA